MPFTFTRPFPEFPDVIVVEPRAFGDERGWFAETYKRSDFEKAGIPADLRQDNHSRSMGKGILRGIHFQNEPMEQGKLVRCVVGEIFDVFVDLRKGSPTHLKSASIHLSAENRKILWLPAGFGHGVQSLTDVAEIVYRVTNEYSVPHDRSIRWDDPQIKIRWPLAPVGLSKKDAEAPFYKDSDVNFTWKGSH